MMKKHDHHSSIAHIHSQLKREVNELKQLPFPCKLELELRIGTLEYSPHSQRGRFNSGVPEYAFTSLLTIFNPELCMSEESWDCIYGSADRRTNVRVSYAADNICTDCICKTWVEDVQLPQCLGSYDARLNLCREIPAALPDHGRQPKYTRHKQRISTVLCESRWRLDMTRVFPPSGKPEFEIELEACDASLFVKNLALLQSDIDYCISLIAPHLHRNAQCDYNNSSSSSSIKSTNYPSVQHLAQAIDSIYKQVFVGQT